MKNKKGNFNRIITDLPNLCHHLAHLSRNFAEKLKHEQR